MTINLGNLIYLYRYKLVCRCGNIQQFSDDHFHFLSETNKQKKLKIEKVLEREKRKDEVVAEERGLAGLDTCSRTARQYQGSFVKDSHKVKVRQINTCFPPVTADCLVCM